MSILNATCPRRQKRCTASAPPSCGTNQCSSNCGGFLAFVSDAVLVIHNASFDMAFINAELSYLDKPPIDMGQVIDTLVMARRKHPMASNSFDALCRRYGIDNSKRTKHGALLDAELLADVYIELLGGRQTALNLVNRNHQPGETHHYGCEPVTNGHSPRRHPLPPRMTQEEREAHRILVEGLGAEAIWKR
jgi:DNA polymerase-3 subunit epsilon